MNVERVVERRPERDDLLHELGIAVRQDLGKDAATAVADEGNARPGAVLKLLQRVEKRPQHHLRIHDVEGDACHLRAVSDSLQPGEWGAQRPVAREKTGDEDHGSSESWRHVDASEDRIQDELQIFEVDPPLEPHGRHRVPVAQVPEVGQDRGRDLLPAPAAPAAMF